MTEKKTRNTMQKKIILETVRSINGHPTVDDVYAEITKTFSNISKNTVYRNLRQLAADGEIRKVSLYDELEKYDNTCKIHYHFQCDVCGMMSDVDMNYMDNIDEAVRQKHNLKIDEHDIVFRGVCSECKLSIDKKID